MPDLVSVHGTAVANITTWHGTAKTSMTNIRGTMTWPSGESLSFHETFNSVSDGLVTGGSAPTGADEPNWTCPGTSPNGVSFASGVARVLNNDGYGNVNMFNTNTATSTSDTDWVIHVNIPADMYHHASFIALFDSDVSDISFEAQFASTGNIIFNGTTYTSAYTLGTPFEFGVKINYGTRKISMYVDGVKKADAVDWSSGSNADNQTYLQIRNSGGTDLDGAININEVEVGTGLLT